MRCSFLLSLLVSAFVSGHVVAADAGSTSRSRKPLNQALLSRLVLEETNRYRASQGRGPVTAAASLTTAAQDHATAMAVDKFFAHKNPHDREQRTLGDRMQRVGLRSRICAENIALTYAEWDKTGRTATVPKAAEYTYRALAKSVMQQWIKSPGHRKNLLGKPYSQMGIGFATAPDARGRERVYCVQTFIGSI
ncbi:MAG TPA: CAP domain-containing protein [Chthoniobacterales bacterium]|jgi:uncharacterized protein YkwD